MPNLSNTVTFLFAGDGSLASDGLSAFLQTKSNFLLLSECRDGATAIADIQTHKPEIAVIDFQLPDMGAMQIVEAVRSGNPTTRIVVLGASPDRGLADELLAAGADAYILRAGPSRHLNEAIRYVRDGGKYLSPQLTKDLPVALNGHSNGTHPEAMSQLHAALEAQALTVARLEEAMGRTQYAIEILQQKVERLTGEPIEAPPAEPSTGSERSRNLPGARKVMSTVAATLILGILGFHLTGILKPAAAKSPDASVTVNSTVIGWELENMVSARVLLNDRQYSAAEKLCRMVLKQDPASLAASRILAAALLHEDRTFEAGHPAK